MTSGISNLSKTKKNQTIIFTFSSTIQGLYKYFISNSTPHFPCPSQDSFAIFIVYFNSMYILNPIKRYHYTQSMTFDDQCLCFLLLFILLSLQASAGTILKFFSQCRSPGDEFSPFFLSLKTTLLLHF